MTSNREDQIPFLLPGQRCLRHLRQLAFRNLAAREGTTEESVQLTLYARSEGEWSEILVDESDVRTNPSFALHSLESGPLPAETRHSNAIRVVAAVKSAGDSRSTVVADITAEMRSLWFIPVSTLHHYRSRTGSAMGNAEPNDNKKAAPDGSSSFAALGELPVNTLFIQLEDGWYTTREVGSFLRDSRRINQLTSIPSRNHTAGSSEWSDFAIGPMLQRVKELLALRQEAADARAAIEAAKARIAAALQQQPTHSAAAVASVPPSSACSSTTTDIMQAIDLPSVTSRSAADTPIAPPTVQSPSHTPSTTAAVGVSNAKVDARAAGGSTVGCRGEATAALRHRLEQAVVRRAQAVQSVSDTIAGLPNDIKLYDNLVLEAKDMLLGAFENNVLQRTAMLAELARLFPIVEVERRRAYSICKHPMPHQDTILEPHKDDEKTAQSLGVIAHVVILAAKYLQVQLRYPPVLCGSRSRIVDPVPVVEVTVPLYRVKTDPRGMFKGAAWLHADVCLLLDAADLPRTAGAHILEELQRLFQTFLQRIPSESSRSNGMW